MTSGSQFLPSLTLAEVQEINKIGKTYSLEYNDIPKMFFTPHHAGLVALMSSEVILSNSVPAMPFSHCCVPVCSNNDHGSRT
jgi:hypothetical protein